MTPDPEDLGPELDDDCGPTRVCRNARDFTFDGIAEDGEDLQTAWRNRLAREGKLGGEAGSIRDLVFDAASE
ncbi:MAG: hypothetical protein GWN79_07595 [Actinobacteria bacterium]|nr:hypothetical protein [Actinomycetota bacterium]NIS30765.1 hypothetical protein [Actinomycetota bacterium]NIT95284.1 hypothetical protein [Actinomycetota bacterium]NIU18958.1 hypothetical protein [Actinomycetota bacterium]NIU65977.1 hypothetical protein [Actinomycetota bacterium]